MRLAIVTLHRFIRGVQQLPWLAAIILLSSGTFVWGQSGAARTSCDRLVPDTSRLFVSVPDPAEFRELWRATELGKLFNDESMEPFGKSLRKQIDDKLAQTNTRLGLKLSDLEGIAGGEMAFCVVQPGGKGRFAIVMLADVRGRDEQVAEVSKKIRDELKKRGGTSKSLTLENHEVSEWTFPATADQPETQAFFATHDDWYIASDHRDTLVAILHRIDGQGNDVLAKLPAYQAVMRGSLHADQMVQLRWFVDPFGLAESIRAADVERERGRDRVKILKEQGFGSIEGVGGVMLVASSTYDFVLHTFVYAPADKRVLAARMLAFPSRPALGIPDWALAEFSGFTALNWEMATAFEASKTLIDAMTGEEEVFEDVLKDIKTEPNGPQIDIRKDLIQNLGKRVYFATHSEVPVSVQSEQRLIAFELTNDKKVLQTLTALKKDPTIRPRNIEISKTKKHLIWEIQSKENLQQNGQQADGFGQFRRGQAAGAANTPKKKKKIFKNGALTVAHGYLIYSSDVKFLSNFLVKTLNNQHKRLAENSEFKAVEAALKQLDDQPQPFLSSFVRLETAVEPNYELFRTGQMPQNQSFIGQLLNAFLAPEDEDVSRKQIIDGSQLPEYDQVRQYMRPGGFKAYAEQNGWRLVGCVLARETRSASRQD